MFSYLSGPIRATIGAALAVMLWSVSALFYCWLKPVHGLQVASLSLVIGGLFCFLIEPRPSSLRAFVPRGVTEWSAILLLFATQVCYIYAFRSAPPGQVDLINYLWPMLLVVSQSLLLQDPIRGKQVGGLVLGFVGPVIVVGGEVLRSGYNPSYLGGYACALASALCWTGYCCLVRQMGGGPTRVARTTHHIVIAGLLSVILQSCIAGWHRMTLFQWAILIALSLAVFGLSYPLWHRGLRYGYYPVVGGMAYAIPLLSIATLIIGGQAELTWTLLIAPFFVVGGCWLLGAGRPNNESPTEAEQQTPAE